jgi:hypothetical protein
METVGSDVDRYQYFGRIYCLHLCREEELTLKIEAEVPAKHWCLSIERTVLLCYIYGKNEEGSEETSHAAWDDT